MKHFNKVKEALEAINIDAPNQLIELLCRDLADYFENGIDFKYEFSVKQIYDWFDLADDNMPFSEWINEIMVYNTSYRTVYQYIENIISNEISYILQGFQSYNKFENFKKKILFRADEFAYQLFSEDRIKIGKMQLFQQDNLYCSIYIGTEHDRENYFKRSNEIFYFLDNKIEYLNPEDGDTGIIWFLRSQGYQLSDLCDIRNGVKKSDFLNHFYAKLENCIAPVFLVDITISDLEHLKKGGNLEINKNTKFCLQSIWQPSNSLVDCLLEKSVVINRDMIYALKFINYDESRRRTGIIGSNLSKINWENVSQTDKQPLSFENFSTNELKKANALEKELIV